MITYVTYIDSPIGPLRLVGNADALMALTMEDHCYVAPPVAGWVPNDAPFAEARRQIDAYFAEQRQTFDLSLAPSGTAFQQRVWTALHDIPFGQTESYGQLARRIGSPKAARAVGLANGRNPISIIVPCHRVIGANGSLTGYGGGIERKRWLLKHERKCSSYPAVHARVSPLS